MSAAAFASSYLVRLRDCSPRAVGPAHRAAFLCRHPGRSRFPVRARPHRICCRCLHQSFPYLSPIRFCATVCSTFVSLFGRACSMRWLGALSFPSCPCLPPSWWPTYSCTAIKRSPLRSKRVAGFTPSFLGGLAVVVYQKREQWLHEIDHRFFRDCFHSQRLLQEVIQNVKEFKAVSDVEREVLREFNGHCIRSSFPSCFMKLAKTNSVRSPRSPFTRGCDCPQAEN